MVLEVLPTDGPELWEDRWTLERECISVLDVVELTNPLEVLIDEDILEGLESFLDPEKCSGLNSEDEDDGAKVPATDPTG